MLVPIIYGTAQLKLRHSFLITRMFLPILFESLTNNRELFASNSCGVTNLTCDWWKPSLHMTLLMSPAEKIQEQDSIAGTQDFPIKASLYMDININKPLQNGGFAWVMNFRALPCYMH